MFVIIGSVTADLMVFSDAPFASHGSDGFRAANLIFTEKPLAVTMGGNGGNSAYVLAGLGAPTALCGSVGRDPLGDTLVGWLAERSVDLTGLERSPSHATSTSTIIMSGAANQVVFHHLGSTTHTRFGAMPSELFSGADGLLCASYPIMTGMRPNGFLQALILTHQTGGVTALDIGPAIGSPVTLSELAPLFPHLDYLLANSHELAELTGETNWEVGVRRVQQAGAKNIVIKRGEHGASVRGQTDPVDVPGFAVEADISVGAGDSFNVGFLFGMQQRWPLPRVVRFANAVAALVISQPRGVLGSPTLAAVESFLQTR